MVFFSSDNGAHKEGGPDYDPAFFNASGPLRGLKRDLTEGGIRVPMLAWAPGYITPGTAVEPVVRNIHIAPTILSLAGARAVAVRHPEQLDDLDGVLLPGGESTTIGTM